MNEKHLGGSGCIDHKVWSYIKKHHPAFAENEPDWNYESLTAMLLMALDDYFTVLEYASWTHRRYGRELQRKLIRRVAGYMFYSDSVVAKDDAVAKKLLRRSNRLRRESLENDVLNDLERQLEQEQRRPLRKLPRRGKPHLTRFELALGKLIPNERHTEN